MMYWRYGIFSLLLFVAVVLLAQKNYDVWTRPIETFQEEGKARKAEPRVEGAFVPGRQQEATSVASTIAISEKNIFNPDRREFSFATPEPSKPMPRPKIILYGVTIAKDFEAASLVQPGRPLRKGEREMLTLKIGQKVGDYKLAKVLPDRITLESGEDSFEVLLYDANAPKKRAVVRTEVKPAEVKSTAPAPVAAPSPPAPVPVPKAAEAPKLGEPSRERVMEAPLPRPVTPPSPSFPGTLRGRTPVRPYTPPESGTK